MQDTKQETKEEDFYDDYNEDDDYLMDKALGNIKNDPGTRRSRPRRIPIYKLTVSDLDKIPKMPEKILKEPNDAEYKKRIDALLAESNKKKESIKELFEKKKQESYGVKSDDKNNIFKQRDELKEKADKLQAKLNAEDKENEPIRNKMNELRDKLKPYERYHFSTNLRNVVNEMKKILEKLSFGEISIREEKQ